MFSLEYAPHNHERWRPGGAIMRVPDDTLSWAEVAARLVPARNYWLCTTMPSGARTQPRCGVW
jgi:hypothetical protein